MIDFIGLSRGSALQQQKSRCPLRFAPKLCKQTGAGELLRCSRGRHEFADKHDWQCKRLPH
jgi:hypothetical protein